MKITRLGPKGSLLHQVLHVEIPDKYDLAMSFVRAQEWYESPKFHHKHFTLEEFMRWYSKEYGKGCFTYPNDWSGFNVPSTALVKFMNHLDWSTAEFNLFDCLVREGLVIPPDPCRPGPSWGKYRARKPFYVIGTSDESNPRTLSHERAHGKFFVDDDYRWAVRKELRRPKYDTKPLAEHLLKNGYSTWNLEDEMHAYVLTGWPEGFKPTRRLAALRRALHVIAARY